MQRALIVEDHSSTRRMLVDVVLEAIPDVLIDQASSCSQARERFRNEHYSYAFFDIGLPDGSGIDLIAEIVGRTKETYIIVTTIFDDDHHLFKALRAGANGYLLKEHNRETLVQQIKGILLGHPPLSPSIARRILEHFHCEADDSKFALSPREAEILTLLAKGKKRNDIAACLNITSNTVADHVKHIYQKLNVNSRAEATVEAIKLGLIDLN